MSRKPTPPWGLLAVAYFIAVCILSFRLIYAQSDLREAKEFANKIQMDCLQQGKIITKGTLTLSGIHSEVKKSARFLEANPYYGSTGDLNNLYQTSYFITSLTR